MAETITLEQATAERHEAIQQNEERGVIPYKNGEKQSDLVYEVVEGYKHLPGVGRIGPGSRFHPTENQVRNGSLKGKARELTRSELSGLRRSKDPSRAPQVSGADIGIRALPMAGGTLKFALSEGMTEADFENVEPAGRDGQYTYSQVEDMVKSKKATAEEAAADAEG